MTPGVPMRMGIADIDRWDPEAVRDVAAAATGRAEAAEAAAAALRRLPAWAGWSGAAAESGRAAIEATRRDLDAHADHARAVARAAAHAADGIAEIKSALRRLEQAAHAAGVAVDHVTGAVVPAAGFRGGPAQFAVAAAPVRAGLEAIITEADAVDTGLARAVGLGWAPVTVPGSPAPSAPPAAAGPAEVRRWWDGLSRAERDRLLRSDPERWGNCDGVASADRDTANRSVMARDIERVEQAAADRHVAAEQVIAHPAEYGLSDAEVTRYTNGLRSREGLARNQVGTGADTLLLVYRPEAFGGQGRAAVAVGDPDTAADTAVVVPGTGHSVIEGWLSGDDAVNLYNEMARADPHSTRSVVAWMGYDAPDSMTDPRIAQPTLARLGGAALAADVNALNATHIASSAGTGHITVVGHSYGSTTVADAAAGSGMRAGDVVLVGCPGTDLARTAADLHLPAGGHVFVGAASSDPVTSIAGVRGTVPLTGQPTLDVGLGADPAANGFGSTRFRAEVPGWTWKVWTDHGHYFDNGSESLFAMADVTAGHGAALQDHGMTAPHRNAALGSLIGKLGLPNWSNPMTDPELARPGSSDNYHLRADDFRQRGVR